MTPMVELRSPEQVMRLERIGSFHQSRLSFMRVLLRRMKREAWTFDRPRFDIDERGVGTALYTAHAPERSYTLVVFAHDLPDDQRSDRVIATAWDATFTLHDGEPTEDDIERLRANVPLQEVGRISERELTLSRANRSVRLWDGVVEALASGNQPDPQEVERVGYLMRTTAVYGSGKFGAADRSQIADRSELRAPFQAEMLTVYLVRSFVLDVVEHIAELRSTEAVRLAPELRRRFGIGNSTGLGMAPFLMTHPRLIHCWIAAREEALRRVRSIDSATPDELAVFRRALNGSARSVAAWDSEHPIQVKKLADLRSDLSALDGFLDGVGPQTPHLWDALIEWSEHALSVEGQELVVSLVLEPYGDLVDELSDRMEIDESNPVSIEGDLSVADTLALLDRQYSWALAIDWSQRSADARAWYTSAEKLEPRLGERHDEPVGDYEQPLQPGRDAAALARTLDEFADDERLCTVLRAHPQHRHIARRLMLTNGFPYAEIRDNTIDAAMLPIDLLRAKLSFFGATRFDPRSDRWVRITMFQGAPFPEELATVDLDGWSYPPKEPIALIPAPDFQGSGPGVSSETPAAPEVRSELESSSVAVDGSAPEVRSETPLSLGEFEALIAKALRGVGYSWGLVEDGAWAARQCAISADDPAAMIDALCELLRAADGDSLGMPDAEWSTNAGYVCPIALGTTIVDSGMLASEPVGPVAAPVLLTPFLDRVGATFSDAEDGRLGLAWLTARRNRFGGKSRRSRVHVSKEQLAELEEFAHRTYAPATEESRRRGAGGA